MINTDVKLDFAIPSDILVFIKELEEYATEETYGIYFNYVDMLDNLCKTAVTLGNLTEKQWDIIMSKYTL